MVLYKMKRIRLLLGLWLILPCLFTAVYAADTTRVVILGTGTPVPDYKRSGPAVAVIHKEQAYLFDAGGGMVQRAIEARDRLGIKELAPHRICCLFLTHLHSDHILDYPELAATLWWRRESKLKAWGPKGLRNMTEGMYAMMAVDIKLRTSGNQPVNNPDYYQVDVTEIEAGIIYKKHDLVIEAFPVPHGDIKPAFAYRITTDDKKIVISGDTAYSKELIEKAKDVDLLIHEVISEKGVSGLSEFWQDYHRSSHTPAGRLAEIARKARPKKLILYHMLFYGVSEGVLLKEIQDQYDGDVILARDLDVFE